MALSTALVTGTSVITGTSVMTGQGTNPIARLLVSFDNDLTLPPAWTDITRYVRQVDYQRGRQWELDQFQSGTLSAVLTNNDGRFAPEFSSSPYTGYLTPMRRVKLIAEWDGVVYPLWAGFVETWEPSTNAHGKDNVTTLKAADAFKYARYVDRNATYPAQLAHDRINTAFSNLNGIQMNVTGVSSVAVKADTFTNADPVGIAQTAAASEQGFLYCDSDGRIRFDTRQYRLTNEQNQRIIFGDAIGEVPYQDAVYSYNDERLYTEVTIQPDGGTAQTSSDATAITQYGKRTLSMSLPIVNSTVDATPNTTWASNLSAYLLPKLKSPGIRLEEFTFYPANAVDYWDESLAIPLGGRLTVRRRPEYAQASAASSVTSLTRVTSTSSTTSQGGILERQVFVERIGMSIKPATAEWMMKFGLSDANTDAYWVVGSSTNSILGSTTRLGL